MILVWGNPSDPPVDRVVSVLQARGLDHLLLADEDLPSLDYDIRLSMQPKGWIATPARRVALEDIRGVFVRPGESRATGHAETAAILFAAMASLDAIVVNRPTAGRSNWSKPFQAAQIQRSGLRVPDTLVTTDPQAARAFLARHGRLVYKSVSGIRSIVATLDAADAPRLAQVASGPVQLQQWVDGLDVRVHVVGEQWFATAIHSGAADYRYASLTGEAATGQAMELPSSLGRQLVRLSHSMGLLLAGIDLRLTSAGEWFCFEVNPAPGFTYFESLAGQPIAEAVAGLLAAPTVGANAAAAV